jgi:hypothetical protein
VPTVRVTCPECEHAFNIPDTRVGGLITCRDCRAEFRVEFAEDDATDDRDRDAREPDDAGRDDREDHDDRPAPRRPATRSRMDVDSEPEAWKTDLPLRSPVPLLLILTGLQVIVAIFLVVNWFVPVTTPSGPPTGSYYYNSSSSTTKPATNPTRKW